MFRFRDFKFLKIYIGCISLYAVAAAAAMVWSYHGPVVSGASYHSRVFRTPDALTVNQLYSGIALSALLAPAGMLVQWIMHDFRHLRLFALTAQKPVALADLDKIGDDSSAWTLRVLGKYSWWYALMQGALIVIRTSIVPVGTLLVTTGIHTTEDPVRTGVVGLPIMPAADSNVRRMATAMGWDGQGTFSQTFDREDHFLNQTVYTFVGNIVSQNALVDVSSGEIGPISTHNISFKANTTYNDIVFYHWNGKCEAALDVPYTTLVNGTNVTYNFTWPNSSIETIEFALARGTKALRMWNSEPESSRINRIPLRGTTYFIATTPDSEFKATKKNESSPGLEKTAEDHWISRTKCTPEFSWEVGSCTFNGTIMTDCRADPGSNTVALDVEALDKLADYMTAIPWYLWNEQVAVIDLTFEKLYSIPTVADWGNYFGNIAQSVAAISTAGYYGTVTVDVVTTVAEEVYIVRTVVLWVMLAMFTLVPVMSCYDIWRSKSRGLPFRAGTFLAIANAVRGPWWDGQLYGSCAADELSMQKRSSSRVMFGADANNPYHVGLLPEVLPIRKGQTYYGVKERDKTKDMD
ncbi:hypothetical protein CPLU01_14781 [Colletotrichum plurivorum]|uniref:Uncharacterized protein n=1 Tax=Colletotrichum plurivorum TaxID=2175906 RepID=A0A8H6JHV2_9PEZI|nr:hypothetical protein CPLU01_14781 [Colletotrichum plurivorum]